MSHIFREANRVADLLARQGHSAGSFDWVMLDLPPPSLGCILAEDARGVCLPRLVP